MVNPIYKSLGQVLKTLQIHENIPEVRHLLALVRNFDLRDQSDTSNGKNIRKYGGYAPKPFLVVEGLDGCGKTTLTNFLSKTLEMQLMSTPPKLPTILETRGFFDAQPEYLRRAFYSLGNYIVAQQIMDLRRPVVVDRFWHSTAAFATAHYMKTGVNQPTNLPWPESNLLEPENLPWPADLLKPDLVIFLQVSEQERIKRHTNRTNFTNTPEEITLAEDPTFRKNLVNMFRKISGPNFLEINVDGEKPEVQARVLKMVTKNLSDSSRVETRKVGHS